MMYDETDNVLPSFTIPDDAVVAVELPMLQWAVIHDALDSMKFAADLAARLGDPNAERIVTLANEALGALHRTILNSGKAVADPIETLPCPYGCGYAQRAHDDKGWKLHMDFCTNKPDEDEDGN